MSCCLWVASVTSRAYSDANTIVGMSLEARHGEVPVIEPKQGQIISVLMREDLRFDDGVRFLATGMRKKIEPPHDILRAAGREHLSLGQQHHFVRKP